ncbi:pirin family protein [Microbacterium sp. YMB-B2]|uniref:Pirin family protein n=1 Tax=Microbacterium tenebrionis TaxID=2830665 RepID=A0A9X1LMC7_9MICO|nr:pirin family protein [Microbacterium tenebrionis]MCC2028368.1 pirin family protein [Microbacterium tenebrionis]
MTNLERSPDVEVLDAGELCTATEVLEPRLVPLGGPRAMTVYRTLPQKQRSLVGAWCFLDHYGPDDVSETGGMQVPRHPHTGLATVSWLFSGRIDHLDSGGNAAAVVPGELNLMIAGRGITHQELSDPATTTLHGVQLWYAMPDATRFGENAFAHYEPEPVQIPGATVRVFIGSLLDSVSPVDTRTPDLLGAELILDPGAVVRLPVRADFELAVLAESDAVSVNGAAVAHRSLAYVPPGSDAIEITASDAGARIILLGGVPLGEQIVMWWNFVGRDHDEIVEFRRRYQAELGFEPADPQDVGKRALFGEFPPDQPKPLPAPALPAVRLRPRE